MTRRRAAPGLRRAALAVAALLGGAAACSGPGGPAPGAGAPNGTGAGPVGSASATGDTGAPAADPQDRLDDDLARSGGAATVFDTSADAFARAAPNLTVEERRAFVVGNNFFNDNWVTAPASTEGRDGLGPTFNAQSCSSCHSHDGRGQPPTATKPTALGLLLRLSILGPDGQPIDDPAYGGQLQDRSINGVPAEGTIRITTEEVPGAYADGTSYSLLRPRYEIIDTAFGAPSSDLLVSPRVAPPVFGVGLLEAVPEADIVSRADPDDANGDGVSGRPNRVVEPRSGELRLGRFGWKANVASVEAQVAGAFLGDIGITSALHPTQNCPTVQGACAAAPTGGDAELDEHKLQRVTFYNRTLAIPARRAVADPINREGEAAFREVGCADCHVTELRTGPDADIPALAGQTIRPYTDLLLHDMGERLADGRPDFGANGRQWKTPPLWGTGLIKDVNGHTRLLHDGRARGVLEAILWHGGEADAAREQVLKMKKSDRDALVKFVESL